MSMGPHIFTIVRVSKCNSDRMPPDLSVDAEGNETFVVQVEGHAQPCYVRITAERRAGVAWGGHATWIDLRAGETAEDAARIVLNDADETERRA